MGKFFRRILLTIFTCILAAGIIGFIVPFDFENFSYKSTYSGSLLEITNSSDETYDDVTVTVYYTLYAKNGTTKPDQKLEVKFDELAKHSTTQQRISFSNNYVSAKVNSIKLTIDSGDDDEETFYIYKNPYFSGINWTFICLIIVGFFGFAVVFAVTKSKQKEQEEEIKNKKTFQERIKEAFTPVMDTINTVKKTYEDSSRRINNEEKPRKITCPYCKGKYSSTEDKCPHCGAPPEPYD